MSYPACSKITAAIDTFNADMESKKHDRPIHLCPKGKSGTCCALAFSATHKKCGTQDNFFCQYKIVFENDAYCRCPAVCTSKVDDDHTI